MGPSTGVSLTPPRRRRERTSSTRFRVATSMRWRFIVPTRTCRVCSLLRFDGKKWCFSRLSDSSSPLSFPDLSSFFNSFKCSASIQMTGPSHAVCNNGCDLHFRRDRYCITVQPATRTWRRRLISPACTRLCLACVAVSIFLAREACSTAVKVLYSTVATAQLAVHTKTELSGFVGNLIRQRHSRCRILSQNVVLSTNDRAFARRVSSVTCTTWVRSLHTPKLMFFTCPNISHSWKQETPTATTLNNKNERYKTAAIVRSLLHVHKFRTPCSNRRRKGQLSAWPRGTIAVLDQTKASFSLHNRAAGRGPYISCGRNL